MQKVEGSNPSAASLKELRLQFFFVGAVGWWVCVDEDVRGRSFVMSMPTTPAIAVEQTSCALLCERWVR
jgi:hypothetical protein